MPVSMCQIGLPNKGKMGCSPAADRDACVVSPETEGDSADIHINKQGQSADKTVAEGDTKMVGLWAQQCII